VLNIEEYEDEKGKINVVTPRKKGTRHAPQEMKQIQQLLQTEHLNAEERKALRQICQKYIDVFHLEEETLTCATVVNHEICELIPHP